MACKANREDLSLNDVCIAAPCQFGWENMIGNDAKRFCGGCNLNVYNTSVISATQVQNILQMDPSQVCLRIHRRPDGTMITDECPQWLRPLRNGWRNIAKVAVTVVALAASLQGALAKDDKVCSSDASSKLTEPKELNLFKIEPTVIDGRHYTAGRDERHPKEWAMMNWPAALRNLGLSSEDLPTLQDNKSVLTMLESFPTGFKMHHQTKVPGKPGLVDLKGWSLYEDARTLHANYWIGVAKRDSESAMRDGQLGLKTYQECIDHLNASKHDPAFMKQVEADYDKLAMLMKRINEQRVQ